MRFTQFYLPPQEYTEDSSKMRVRLGSFIEAYTNIDRINYSLVQQLKQKIGIPIQNTKLRFCDFENFFNTIGLNQLLDSITVIYQGMENFEREKWKDFVNTVFDEEQLCYVLTNEGYVRFNPDEEFERNRILTLKNLSKQEFSSALTAFNSAFNAFQTDVNKSKHAIRDIFEANEIIYKKITKKLNHTRLTSTNIEAAKSALIRAINYTDPTAKTVFEGQIESFKKWVDPLHYYRHGQDTETYDTPPIDLTILILSNGASFLRWLASIPEIT